jgi:hypothetical protein
LADFLSEVGEDAHKTGLNLLQSGAKNIHAPMPLPITNHQLPLTNGIGA